jgi:hypothetical protein
MIPTKLAPGHSRPKDGVASLAYDPGVGTGFPSSRSPLRRVKARSKKIMRKQKASRKSLGFKNY